MYNIEQLIPLADSLPEEYKQNAVDLLEKMGTVIEGVGDRPIEWSPTLLKIVQGTTDRSNLPKGTAIGSLLLGEEVVDAPLGFIPLRLNVGRQYWNPDPAVSKVICRSPDAKLGSIGQECKTCSKSQWVEGQGSECSKVYQLLGITSDLSTIFMANFSKTSYKVGMELEQILRKAGVPPYLRTYGLNTETSTTAKNVEMFKIEVPGPDKRRTPPELVPFLKALFDQVSESRKQLLVKFYENAAARRDQAALTSGEADMGHRLTDQTGADRTLDVGEETVIDTGSGSMGYTM